MIKKKHTQGCGRTECPTPLSFKARLSSSRCDIDAMIGAHGRLRNINNVYDDENLIKSVGPINCAFLTKKTVNGTFLSCDIDIDVM